MDNAIAVEDEVQVKSSRAIRNTVRAVAAKASLNLQQLAQQNLWGKFCLQRGCRIKKRWLLCVANRSSEIKRRACHQSSQLP